MKKLIFLQSHPIQYFDPLSQLFGSEKEVDFEVWYCSDLSIKGEKDFQFGVPVKWDIPMLEGYKFRFFKNYSPKPGVSLRFWGLMNWGIISAMFRSSKAIIVVHGWNYFSFLLAIILGSLMGHKIWIKSESPLNQELKKSFTNRTLKRIFFKYFLFRFIDKFLFIGKQNKRFYVHFGVKEKDLIYTPYSVDNLRFKKLKNDVDKNEIRTALNIAPTDFVILYSGKYIHKKRPQDILEAYSKLPQSNKCLILMGEGALRKELEMFIKVNNIEKVLLTGFINQAEIGKYYAIADVFVLCSDIGETWGLSVNEAMNFDLPIIVSDMPGCGYDLVKNNVNGFIFPTGNITALLNVLNKISSNKDLCLQMGKRSGDIIQNYSFDTTIYNTKIALELNKHLHKQQNQ